MINFQKLFRETRARAKKDQRGLNLVELIVTLGVGGLIVFLAFILFQVTVTTQKSLSDTTASTSTAQTAMARFQKAVRTSNGFKVTNANRVDLQTPDGKCQVWYVEGSTLKTKTSNVLIGSLTSGSEVLSNVKKVGSNAYFTTAGVGVTYSFSSGEGVGKVELVGTVNPRSPAPPSLLCF